MKFLLKDFKGNVRFFFVGLFIAYKEMFCWMFHSYSWQETSSKYALNDYWCPKCREGR